MTPSTGLEKKEETWAGREEKKREKIEGLGLIYFLIFFSFSFIFVVLFLSHSSVATLLSFSCFWSFISVSLLHNWQRQRHTVIYHPCTSKYHKCNSSTITTKKKNSEINTMAAVQTTASFPHILSKRSENAKAPGVLTNMLEERIQKVQAIPESNWLLVDGVAAPFTVQVCPTDAHTLACREPIVKFSFAVPKDVRTCIAFFSNFNLQGSPDINPNLTSVEVKRVVKDGKLVEYKSFSDNKTLVPFNNKDNWAINYKNVSYVYATLQKVADFLQSMDSADIFTLRIQPDKSWILGSVGMYMENHIATVEVRRLQNFVSVLTVAAHPTEPGHTIVTATSLVAVQDCPTESAVALQIEMGVARYLRALNHLTTAAAPSAAVPIASTHA
jgi:hypothetical protein